MFNSDCSMFVDRYDDVTTPTRSRLYSSCGCILRDIDTGSFQETHSKFLSHLSKPEFTKVVSRPCSALA